MGRCASIIYLEKDDADWENSEIFCTGKFEKVSETEVTPRSTLETRESKTWTLFFVSKPLPLMLLFWVNCYSHG